MSAPERPSIRFLRQCYLQQACAKGVDYVRRNEQQIASELPPSELALWRLYEGLCLLELHPQTGSRARQNSLKRLQKIRADVKNQGESARNTGKFSYALLSAELARLDGNVMEAMQCYEQAIQETATHQQCIEVAVVNEYAARFYLEQGQERLARGYMQDAWTAYHECGITSKTAQLQKRYPQWPWQTGNTSLAERSSQKRSTTRTLTSIVPSTLDMIGIVKAAQMISEEVRLGHLLKRLIRTVIEQAGATKGIFLAWKDEHLWIRTKGQASPGASPELIEEEALGEELEFQQRHDLPISVINYVVRSRQALLMNNVSDDHRFAADRYLASAAPKSLFCLPVQHHHTFDGVLYLENNLTTGAFTPEQVEVLKVLTSQAAISIENATVYEHLEQKVRERTARLAATTARCRTLAEAAFEGLIIHDQGHILEVNNALETLTGYRTTELKDRNAFDLFTPESRAKMQKRIAVGHTGAFEAEAVRQDGSVFPVELQTREISWEGLRVSLTAVRDISWRRKLEEENQALRVSLENRDRLGELVGRSAVMRKVYARLLRAAASESTTIIYGETGTGKELAARTIFALSDHHSRNFVPINCGAIQEPLFEAQFFGYRKGAFTGAMRDSNGFFGEAEGGTLFLDEVGELTLTMQAKLLRVLNDGVYTPVGAFTERQSNVRIIAATNHNLRALVEEGQIREDFFHRLHVLSVELPPLRQHKEDIPLLIAHFWEQHLPSDDEAPVLPREILERLTAYDWPGNIRELFNELQRYLATGEIELGGASPEPHFSTHSFPFLRAGLSLNEAVDAFEAFYINRAIEQAQGQKKRAAADLGIDRSTLYVKLKKFETS